MQHSPLCLVFVLLLPVVVFGQFDLIGGLAQGTIDSTGNALANISANLPSAGQIINGNELEQCIELDKIEYSINEAWDAVEDMMAEVLDVPAVLFKKLIEEGINEVKKPITNLIADLEKAVGAVKNEMDKMDPTKLLTIPPGMPEITVPTVTMPTIPPVTVPEITIPPVTMPPVTLPPITAPKIPCLNPWGC